MILKRKENFISATIQFLTSSLSMVSLLKLYELSHSLAADVHTTISNIADV